MLNKKLIYKNVTLQTIESIEQTLKKWCEDKSYKAFEVIIVLHELYNNAADYSNGEIDLFIKFYSKAVVIRINDQGKGFNAKQKLKISDCDLKENVHKTCGRGIYIVKAFVSDIYYNQKGNNVLVRIKENK